MKHIYKNQTALRLSLVTGVEFENGDSAEIKYKKPDGTVGTFPAAISQDGIIFHDFTDPDEIDQTGWWKFWAFVTFSDERTAAGKSVSVHVYEEGS